MSTDIRTLLAVVVGWLMASHAAAVLVVVVVLFAMALPLLERLIGVRIQLVERGAPRLRAKVAA